MIAEDQASDFVQIEKQHSEPPVNGNYGLMTIVDLEEMNPQQKPEEQEVIDLSDDELPPQNSKNEGQQIDYGDPCIPPIWHYVDPQGIIQGPFSLYDLKRWSDADYFHPGFTVWRSGQSQHDAVPLLNLLHQIFPLWTSRDDVKKLLKSWSLQVSDKSFFFISFSFFPLFFPLFCQLSSYNIVGIEALVK